MEKIKKSLQISNAILNLSEEKEWSEEELAKAIELLHSELNKENLIQGF